MSSKLDNSQRRGYGQAGKGRPRRTACPQTRGLRGGRERGALGTPSPQATLIGLRTKTSEFSLASSPKRHRH